MSRWEPWLFDEDGIDIGPIPKGTPINLIANMNLEQRKKMLTVLATAKDDLKALPKNATNEEAREVFADLVEPMLEVSECPDFVVNRGHYFGSDYFAEESGLGDDDKWALIEFLKTM